MGYTADVSMFPYFKNNDPQMFVATTKSVVQKYREQLEKLKEENEKLKMKLVSLEEFKEKAFEENTASAVCESMMERIDNLEEKVEDYKQTITTHKNESLKNLQKANSYDELIMILLFGKDELLHNIDGDILSKLNDNVLETFNEVLDNNGIYYCSNEDDFADNEADIDDADMCAEFRDYEDMEDDDDIDVGDYCDWYCSNYGVNRHWLNNGFIWEKKMNLKFIN